MKSIKAPWRAKYFDRQKTNSCPFCEVLNDGNAKIIHKGKNCFVLMNKHPYSYGHIMVIPYEHKRFLDEIELCVWDEMSHLVRIFEKILRQSLNAGGVNIGMNLGEVAGASIAAHMHYHLVPRWFGDTNFMATIGETRVLGANEDDIYKILKKAFDEYNTAR